MEQNISNKCVPLYLFPIFKKLLCSVVAVPVSINVLGKQNFTLFSCLS